MCKPIFDDKKIIELICSAGRIMRLLATHYVFREVRHSQHSEGEGYLADIFMVQQGRTQCVFKQQAVVDYRYR